MPEEKDIQQIADEFVTALVNTVGEGTVQEVVEKNKDDALDITNIATALPLKEMPPEAVKYLKELSQIVKDTSMDTRHDLSLAFPPSHFSGESNPLMLYYKAFYDTVAYYTALIQSTPEMRDALINIYRYYKCVGAKKHICRKKAVRKEWIEEIAFMLTMKILMSDDDLQKIADRIMELQKAESTMIPVLERQLEDVRASIDNILKAIEMGVCTRSTKARLEELEEEEERIKCDIECEQKSSQLITEDQIWYIFDKFRKMDLTMPKQRQRLFDSFLQSIVLFDDRLIISFNYRSQPVTIMLDQLIEFVNGDISDLKSSASPIRKAPRSAWCFSYS